MTDDHFLDPEGDEYLDAELRRLLSGRASAPAQPEAPVVLDQLRPTMVKAATRYRRQRQASGILATAAMLAAGFVGWSAMAGQTESIAVTAADGGKGSNPVLEIEAVDEAEDLTVTLPDGDDSEDEASTTTSPDGDEGDDGTNGDDQETTTTDGDDNNDEGDDGDGDRGGDDDDDRSGGDDDDHEDDDDDDRHSTTTGPTTSSTSSTTTSAPSTTVTWGDDATVVETMCGDVVVRPTGRSEIELVAVVEKFGGEVDIEDEGPEKVALTIRSRYAYCQVAAVVKDWHVDYEEESDRRSDDD